MNKSTPTEVGIGQRILRLWLRLSPWPGGRRLFSWLVGYTVPYSGTIRPLVVSLAPGSVTIRLKDRRKVRNHLRCIHAIALVNLGEIASGLSLLTSLPGNARGIVTHIDIDYFKKARGDLTAHGRADPITVNGDTQHTVYADIFDRLGERVAAVTVQWQIGLIDR